MAATETNQDYEEESNEIEVEWERQMELRRSQRSKLNFIRESQPSCTELGFDPLIVTFLDDDSAFRIGAFLKTDACAVTRISLKVRAETLSEQGARAFSNDLKLSRVVDLELSLDNNNKDTSPDSTPPESWKLILDGAIDAVPELDLKINLDDALAIRIGTNLLKGNNTTLQKLKLRFTSSTLTVSGARKLTEGFHQAQIKTLKLVAFKAPSPKSRIATSFLASQAVLANVQHLFLYYELENAEACTLGAVLLGNTSLKTLSFTLSGDLTEESAMVLANGICHSQVTTLSMDGGDEYYTNGDAEDIIYKEGIQHSPTIRHLRLGPGLNVNETESFGLCLSALHSLKILKYYDSDDYHDNEMLFDDLMSASQLQSLTIQHELLARELKYLSNVLPHLSSLTHLKVQGNLTCKEGEDLVKEDRRFHNAENLDENGNPIPLAYSELAARSVHGFAVGHLMLEIATHPALYHLDLSGSTDIGFLGLSALGYLLQFVQLRELRLEGISDVFSPEYSEDYEDDDTVRAARAVSFQLLVDGVRSNDHLQKVSLDDIHFPSTVVEEINFQLEVKKFQTFLSDEELECGVWSHILAKCHDNVGIMFYLLKEQPMLLIETATPAGGHIA